MVDAKLTEVIQAFGITKDQLTSDTQASLDHLAELGMLLNLSDLTLPSFQQAFSLLRLDTLQPHTLHAHETQEQTQARVDTHLARAEHELQELLQLRDTLARERGTVHDMEIRNKRRSVELMRREFQQKTEEEQIQQQALGGGGGDVEAQGLTVSQIKAQEAVVVGLQDQLDVQTKNLAAYQEIPPVSILCIIFSFNIFNCHHLFLCLTTLLFFFYFNAGLHACHAEAERGKSKTGTTFGRARVSGSTAGRRLVKERNHSACNQLDLKNIVP